MGLDIILREDPGRYHVRFGYCDFNEYRRFLASLIGINLDEMWGYGGTKSWGPYRDDPLTVLLDHSDCDGEIEPEDAEPLADRLKELIDHFDESDKVHQYWKTQTEKLIKILRRAAETGEQVLFR